MELTKYFVLPTHPMVFAAREERAMDGDRGRSPRTRAPIGGQRAARAVPALLGGAVPAASAPGR
jgi:hypothetical protein